MEGTTSSSPTINRPRYGRATAITAAMPQATLSNSSTSNTVTQPTAASNRPPDVPAKPVPPPKPKPAVAPKPNFAQPNASNQQPSAAQPSAKPSVNYQTGTSQPTVTNQPQNSNGQPVSANGQPAAGTNDSNAGTGGFSALHTSMISEYLGRRPGGGAPASKGSQPAPASQQQQPNATGTGHKSVTFKNVAQPEVPPASQTGQGWPTAQPSNTSNWSGAQPTYQNTQLYQNAQTAKPVTEQPAANKPLPQPQPQPQQQQQQQPQTTVTAPASRFEVSTRPAPGTSVSNGSRVQMATSKSNLDDITTNIVEMDKAIDDVQFNIERIDSTLDELANYNKRFMSAIDQLSDDEDDQAEPGAGASQGGNEVEKRTDAAIRELLNSVDTLKRNTQSRPLPGSRTNLSRSNEQLLQPGPAPGPTQTVPGHGNSTPNAKMGRSAAGAGAGAGAKGGPRPGERGAAGPYTETNIDDAKSLDDSDSDDQKKATEISDQETEDSDAEAKWGRDRKLPQQPVYANLPLAGNKKPDSDRKAADQKGSVPTVAAPSGPAGKLSVAQKAKLFEAAASGQQINQPTPTTAPAPTPAPTTTAKGAGAPALPPRAAKSPKPTAKPRGSKTAGSGSTEILGTSPEPEYTNQATITSEAKRRGETQKQRGRADFVSEDELEDEEDGDSTERDDDDEYYRDDEIPDVQYDDTQRFGTRARNGAGQKSAINETDVTATRQGKSNVPKSGKYAVEDDARITGRPGSQMGQFRRTRSDHQLAARTSRQLAAVDSIELDSDDAYDEDDRATLRSAGGRSGSPGSINGKKGMGGPASRAGKGGSGGLDSSMRSHRPLPRLPSAVTRPHSSEYSDLDMIAQPTYANQPELDQRHSDLQQGDYMNTDYLAGRPGPKGSQSAKVQRTRSRSVQDFQRLLKDDSRSRLASRPGPGTMALGDEPSTTASMLSLADLRGLPHDELERLIRSYLDERKREKMAGMLKALLAERDRDETLRSLIDQYGDEMLELVGGRGAPSARTPQRSGTLGSLFSAANTFDRDRLGGRSERLNAARPRDREETESVGTLGIGPGYSSLRLPRGGGLGLSVGSIGDADAEGRLGLSLIAPLRIVRAGPNDIEEPPPAMKPAPKPQPPMNRRAHLFESISRFEELDRHVAQVAQSDDFLTFRSLVIELTRTCADDIERCRAIFRWVTTKDLSVIDIDPEGVSSPESLLGTLRAVKTGSKSYNELFRKLCLFAGLHCETIHGVSKGAGYTPGTNVKDNRMFRNTWTAVHLNGEWRIVNAAWGARHLLRYYKRKATGESATLPTYSGSRSQLALNRTLAAGSQGTLRSQPSRLGTLRADGTLVADGQGSGFELIKSDDFYFLPDPEFYIYEHFPDKKAWQLLKRSITLDDFMKLPILKSNFFNSGLRLKKPYTETLDTRDGRVDIHIDMPRYVGMTATLLNRADMVEIKGLTLVRTVGAGNECVITCEPPKIGKYYLNIYVSENWKDDAFLGLTSGFELACAFQIKCADPNLDRLVIGRYPPNLGCLGKTPVADRLGLVPTREHSDPFIVHTDKEEIRIGMLVLPGLKVQHQLTYFDRSGKQMQQCDQYALLQTRNKRASYVIRCPADGYYLLTVYAAELRSSSRVMDTSVDDPAARTDDGTMRPGGTSAQQLECVLRYLIDARKPLKVAAFPKQSSRWVGAYLLEPTTKQLYVDSKYVFRIVAPACSTISVVINAKTWLDLKQGRESVWEARISTGAELGELSVYAKFRADGGDQLGTGASAPAQADTTERTLGGTGDDKFIKLLDYEIVSAPLKTKK